LSRLPFGSSWLLASERDGQPDTGAGSRLPPFAWTSLLVILVAAPEVYDQALRLPTGERRAAEIGFLAALSGFIALLAIGVVRRWRWTFWLVLVAFLFGVLRVPVAILQLTGILAADGTTWYVAFQGLLGVLQFAIGLAMVAGYRRAGVWGAC
jgi:hypothetical protein